MRAHLDVPPGTWSDDGAQALCLLESLLKQGRFDPDDFARRMLDWYEHGHLAVGGYVFDVGTQTRAALQRIASGTPPLPAAAREVSAKATARLSTLEAGLRPDSNPQRALEPPLAAPTDKLRRGRALS